jgi:16S rRNA (cytosine967-C5)-methyltransferase
LVERGRGGRARARTGDAARRDGAAGTSAPSPSPPRTGRDLARLVLGRVEQEGAFANRALAAELDRAMGLAIPERALATELVYGVLRRRSRLDRALEAVADRGLASLEVPMRILLRVGAYQLLFLDRIPSYAAVNEAVETAKRAYGAGLGGLTNALLRRVAERGEPPLPDAARDPLGYLIDACGLPEWMARLALGDLGTETAIAWAAQIGVPAPLALRANRLAGTTVEALASSLAAERPDATLLPSTAAPDALLARGLEAPAQTRAFVAGAFAIQDVGAQLVAELCGAAPGDRVLDACAGLGGKTAHLAALAGNQAHIEALDRSGAKLAQAREQWQRLGARELGTRVADLTRELPADTIPYHRVLLDAPCAGLGVLRRHPEALLRRTEADLSLLAATQQRMLDVLAPHVAAGGLLVYAVCTFDRAEGEGVVTRFLAGHPQFRIERPIATAGGVPWDRLIDAGGFMRTWPQRDDADAFFAVRLRRGVENSR